MMQKKPDFFAPQVKWNRRLKQFAWRCICKKENFRSWAAQTGSVLFCALFAIMMRVRCPPYQFGRARSTGCRLACFCLLGFTLKWDNLKSCELVTSKWSFVIWEFMRKYAGHNDWYAWLPFKVCFFKKSESHKARQSSLIVCFLSRRILSNFNTHNTSLYFSQNIGTLMLQHTGANTLGLPLKYT